MQRFSAVLIVYVCYLYYSNGADEILPSKRLSNGTVDQKFVKLHLYTKFNETVDIPDWSFGFNETDLNSTFYFNSSNSLVIILHGFQAAYDDSLIQLVKDAFLYRGGWNVVLVDWGPLSRVARYEDAVSSAYSISLLLGKWLASIVSKEYTTMDKIHLVGFSIGAHMAGVVGKQLGGKVAKIYALDPAFPIYTQKPDSERLHKSDAEFVEVIHTCGYHISYETSLGHVDIYPNGGVFPQPDCLNRESDVWSLEIVMVMTCSHNIAMRYFAESVFDETKFKAVKCGSWSDFQQGNCSSERIPFGYATPTNVTGDYYTNLYLNISKTDVSLISKLNIKTERVKQNDQLLTSSYQRRI